MKEMFLREAKMCEQLHHKNIVKAYRTGQANGVFYILMDLCEGGSAEELMKKNGGKLSVEMATWITLQTLDGLDYLHNAPIEVQVQNGLLRGAEDRNVKGLVHRDFKPGNIFLSDSSSHPTAMVADFGMAKAFDAAGMSRLTKTGQVMGTPVFMPRQQALNFKYSKPEVDVWAAAASYYYMLTGALPKEFSQNKNPWQVIVAERAVPIRSRNSSIPKGIASVIDQALIEQPEIGYQSAAQLRRDLVRALPANVKNYCKGVL